MNTLDTPEPPKALKPAAPLANILRRLLVYAVALTVACYIALCGTLWALQDQLVFPGRRTPDAAYAQSLAKLREATQRPVEEVAIESSDGLVLSGWFLDGGPDSPVVLICHGNGDDVANGSGFMREAWRLAGASCLAFDYRGYGRSEGTPTEEGVLVDARVARKWLATRTGVKESDVILWGVSLGGGVAIDLAQDGARGLLTEMTFTSLPDVAEARFSLVPVRSLMHNEMNSLAKIKNVVCPTFIAHGDSDTLVPYHHSEKLFAASPANVKKHIKLEGLGHFTPFRPQWDDPRRAFFASVIENLPPLTEDGQEGSAAEFE